jgi:NifU-like protein involved in Fe-S cluster formation
MNMIRGSAQHEEYKQQVLQQHEDEALAKFKALIPTLTNDIPAALDALGDLAAVRGLTPNEKRIVSSLMVLDACRAALSCFTPEAHALRTKTKV